MRQVKHLVTLGLSASRSALDPTPAAAGARISQSWQFRSVIALGWASLLTFAVACSSGGSPRPAQSGAENGTGEATTASTSGGKASMPGECIDPLVDGDKRDGTRPFDKHVQADVRSEDLDGDGEYDTFVKPAWSCGSSCYRSAYVVRGTCAHYVGTFLTTDRFESMDGSTNGLKDILTRPQRKSEADGEWHCFQTVLKFNGTEYKPAKERECECKDEGAKCTAWGQ